MPHNDCMHIRSFTPPLSDSFPRDCDPFSGHTPSPDYSVESISDYLCYAEKIQADDIAIEDEILLLSVSFSNTEISNPLKTHTSPSPSTTVINNSPIIATNVIKESIDNYLRFSSGNNDRHSSKSLYRSPKRKTTETPCLRLQPPPVHVNYPKQKSNKVTGSSRPTDLIISPVL